MILVRWHTLISSKKKSSQAVDLVRAKSWVWGMKSGKIKQGLGQFPSLTHIKKQNLHEKVEH